MPVGLFWTLFSTTEIVDALVGLVFRIDGVNVGPGIGVAVGVGVLVGVLVGVGVGPPESWAVLMRTSVVPVALSCHTTVMAVAEAAPRTLSELPLFAPPTTTRSLAAPLASNSRETTWVLP